MLIWVQKLILHRQNPYTDKMHTVLMLTHEQEIRAHALQIAPLIKVT